MESISQNSLDDLDVSIYHLVFIGNSIENAMKAFVNIIDKVNDQDEKAIYAATCSLALIQTVSFLDEFHSYVKSPNKELNNEISKIKKAVKPAISQINQWTELRDFRNNVLAHNLRDRKQMISVFEKGLNSYDIPKNGADFLVLYNCVSLVKQAFESVFKKQLQTLQTFFNRNSPPAKLGKFHNTNDAQKAIAEISNEINRNIFSLKMDTQ